MQDRYVDNDGVRLHYINQEGDEHSRLPLVYVPGMLAPAEALRDEIPRLGPRRIISLSRRGHGKSDASDAIHYNFASFVSDIEAVIADTHIERHHLIAYSAGVPMALRYTLQHPESVESLLLLDFPARYPNYSAAWADKVKAARPDVPEHIIDAIQGESTEVDLRFDMQEIRCTARLIFGEKSQAVTDRDLDDYRRYMPHLQMIRFADADHELWKPDYNRFINAVNDFLDQAEENRT